MCGRFTLSVDLHEILDLLPGLNTRAWLAKPRYNIAPTQMVATVPNVLNDDGALSLTYMRWGLIPFWAKDHTIGSKLINARGETAHEKPSFRASFKRKRCLVLADGFYEWAKVPGQKRKQPVYIHMQSGKPFAFAGLWDHWHDPAGTGDELVTCTIVTTEPNEVVNPYHNRMPVILPPDDFDVWLEPGEADTGHLLSLIRPYPAGEMEAYPVSTQVNSPGIDDPALVEPLDEQQNLL